MATISCSNHYIIVFCYGKIWQLCEKTHCETMAMCWWRKSTQRSSFSSSNTSFSDTSPPACGLSYLTVTPTQTFTIWLTELMFNDPLDTKYVIWSHSSQSILWLVLKNEIPWPFHDKQMRYSLTVMTKFCDKIVTFSCPSVIAIRHHRKNFTCDITYNQFQM